MEKIVVVAPDLSRLRADARIVQGLQWRQSLGKEPGLHLLGNFQLLRPAPLRLLPLRSRAALRFHFTYEIVARNQGKRISVQVVEPRENAAPQGRLGGMMKVHSALLPLLELGNYVFGDKHAMAAASNQLGIFRVALRCDQRENRVPIGRRHRQRPSCRFIAVVHHDRKSKLVAIKLQTALLIAHKDVDAEKPKIRIMPIEPDHVAAHRNLLRKTTHCGGLYRGATKPRSFEAMKRPDP